MGIGRLGTVVSAIEVVGAVDDANVVVELLKEVPFSWNIPGMRVGRAYDVVDDEDDDDDDDNEDDDEVVNVEDEVVGTSVVVG